MLRAFAPWPHTGKWYKVFSIVLEVFQLGALFPTAAFEHGSCLNYQYPLDIPLYVSRK